MNIALRFQLSETDFERSVTIPPGLTLFALHDIAQLLFGFDDIYSWSFFDSRKNLYAPDVSEGGRRRGFRTYDAVRHTVGELFPSPGTAITYRYGEEEEWTIAITRQADPDGDTIVCTHVAGPNAIDELDGPRDLLEFLEELRTSQLKSGNGKSRGLPEYDDLLLLGLGDPSDRKTFLAGPDPANLTDELRKTVLEHIEAASRVALFKGVKPNSPCPCGSGQKYKDCCRGKYDSYGFPIDTGEDGDWDDGEEEDGDWDDDIWEEEDGDGEEGDWEEDGDEGKAEEENGDSSPDSVTSFTGPLHNIQLKMELLNTKSKRIVTLPSEISFYDLHLVVQKLFGFDNDHLWLFHDAKTGTEYGCDVTPWDWEGRYGPDPHLHSIGETFRAPKDTAKYWYDFGDDWFVRITRMADPKEGPPACLESTGTNGIDDIGGPRRLNGFIKQLEELESNGADDLDYDDDPDGQSFWGFNTREKRRAFLAGPSAEELSAWLVSQDSYWRASIGENREAETRRKLFKGVGRNDPCPCGSGKKFKKCCLGKYDKNGYPVGDGPSD